MLASLLIMHGMDGLFLNQLPLKYLLAIKTLMKSLNSINYITIVNLWVAKQKMLKQKLSSIHISLLKKRKKIINLLIIYGNHYKMEIILIVKLKSFRDSPNRRVLFHFFAEFPIIIFFLFKQLINIITMYLKICILKPIGT
jgi:hypothetical protein